MKKNLFYRILSFLLVPPALLFSIGVLVLIAAAIANPTMLLPLFLVACVAIYTFTSFYFLLRGVDQGKNIGRSTRDWIKVNAIVCLVFATLMIIQSIILTAQPEMLDQVLAEAKKQSDAIDMSQPQLLQYMKVMMTIFLIYSIILLIHVLITFKLLKKHAGVFISNNEQNIMRDRD